MQRGAFILGEKKYMVRWHTNDSSIVRATSKEEAVQEMIDYPEDYTDSDMFANIEIDEVEEMEDHI